MTSTLAVTNAQECLLLFMRYPEVGQVKTRLIPDLGVEAATNWYRQLAEHAVAHAKVLKNLRSVDITVWFTGGNEAAFKAWLGTDLTYQPQVQGDLGDRLSYAFQVAFNQGYQSVVAVGTDCPQLDTAIYEQGFQQLQIHDLVIGPANDGGYYLIGLKQATPTLFHEIAWSTSVVFQQTLKIAAELGLTCARLPDLIDIDTLDDLIAWQQTP